MEIITQVKEVLVTPCETGMAVSVRKQDVIVDNGVIIGNGTKGEYTDSFELLPTQVDGIINFMGTAFGKTIPKDQKIVAVNVQVVNEDMFVSIATNKPLLDMDGNQIGQTATHRTVIDLNAKQQKMIAEFVSKDLDVLQADVQTAEELKIEAQTLAMLEEQKEDV